MVSSWAAALPAGSHKCDCMSETERHASEQHLERERERERQLGTEPCPLPPLIVLATAAASQDPFGEPPSLLTVSLSGWSPDLKLWVLPPPSLLCFFVPLALLSDHFFVRFLFPFSLICSAPRLCFSLLSAALCCVLCSALLVMLSALLLSSLV